MNITIKEVEHLAELSQLNFSEQEKENFVAGVWLCECGRDSKNNSGITYINPVELQYTRKAILGTAFKEATKPGNALENHLDWHF